MDYTMHYYKFNIGDYASHTQHLDPIEDIAYRRMLDWVYLHESPLPDCIEQIGRLIRMRTHSDSIAVVLQEFFVLTDYGWMQEKASEEIDAYKEKSQKAKASAKARWAKELIITDANALQPDSERNANHKPLTIKQETINKKTDKAKSSSLDWGLIGLTDQQKNDIKGIRTACKKKLTQLALNAILKELELAKNQYGIGYDESIEIWAVRGWTGFKAEWAAKHKGLINDQRSSSQATLSNLDDTNW